MAEIDFSKNKIGFFNQLSSLSGRFWFLNVLQMLEKLAYWSVLLQMPVYTAQKGIEGGLHWEQWVKGFIFFIWAMVQNLTPFFFGFLPDKAGQKKITFISIIAIIISYFLLGTQHDFYPFVGGIILLGIGSGLFKPSVQGALSLTLDSKNSSLGWGVYFMLLNLAVIAAPPLSKYLKEISWQSVFIGSAVISILNLAITSFWRNGNEPSRNKIKLFHTVKESLTEFIKPRVFVFILCMSGFAIIYMQFYETLPNFIYDWSYTGGIARSLYLPDFMLMTTPLGRVISYEWLYNINSLLVTLFVVLMAWLTGFISRIKAIILGIILAALGLFIAGFSMNGGWLIIGFIIYTFGELITNPKFTDHLSASSPVGKKSMHLGFLNLSLAIGLGAGALLGGGLYGSIAEKSTLALKYLTETGITHNSINPALAFEVLRNKMGLSAYQATELLWQTYQPWHIWLPFIAIAGASVIGLFIYEKKFK